MRPNPELTNAGHELAHGRRAGDRVATLLAPVPPLWRRVMDPRVLALAGGELSRVNRGRAT